MTDNDGLTNTTTQPITVDGIKDLVIISFTSTHATIKNQGNADITTPFQTTIYGAPQWTNTPFKIPLYTETTPSLAAGTTILITYSVPTYFYYGIFTDSTKSIIESNENNNRMYILYP